jgi:PAS domain S-box-containing protein
MDSVENPTEEIRRLRRTIRDLVALSTLPAVWMGLSPQGIASSLADVLFSTLTLELVYVRLGGSADKGLIEVARSAHSADASLAEAMIQSLAPFLSSSRVELPSTIPNLFGPGALHIAVTRFGVAEDFGVLITGSRDAEFPTERDRLLLGVGANQTAIVVQRRRAEEQLRDQGERLRTTLASIGDGVITTDTEALITNLNPVAESITGWTNAEALGRPLHTVFRIVNESTRQPVENPAERVLREGAVVGLANHTVLIAKDGTERPIDDSAAPIRDETGAAVGAVLVFRDVSERKLAEEAQLRLAAIVESSEDAIVSKTLDGIIRTWNSGAQRLFGYTPQEAVGQPITLLIPSERFDEEREILARLGRGERIEHYETVRLAKDGRRIDVSLSVSPLRNSEGIIVGASKIAHDISERKQAADRLKAGEEKFRTLFESIDQGFCVIELMFDEENRPIDYWFVEMNPAFERHTGLTAAVGRRAKDLVPDLEAFWFETYGRVVMTGEPARFESDAAGMDGRWFDVYAFRVGGSESHRLAVLFSDVTARKRAEREREQLLRKLESEQRRLTEVFQRAPSFMCVLRGPDHVFERANDRYYQVVGHRDIIGKPVLQALPEIEGQGFVELLNSVYESGDAFVGTDISALLQRKPGDLPEERSLDLVYQPLRDPDGTITGILAQGIDITERKRAEAELRSKTERLNLLIENTRDYAVVFSDPDGTVIEWQGGAERITGYSEADARGKNCDLIFTPEDRAAGRPAEEMSEAARVGRAEDKRWHQRKDGSRFFADGVMTALLDDHGMLRGFGKVFKDSTSEELAKESRKEHTERLKKLADVSTRLNAVLDLKSVLSVVTEEGRALIRAHQAVMEVSGDTDGAIRSFSLSEELRADKADLISPSRLVIYETVAEGSETVRLTHDELQAHIGWRNIKDAAEQPPPLRGLLATPIFGPSGETIGVIQLSDKQAGEFTEEDEAIVIQIAQMAAVAIENTRLYQALRAADRKKDDFLALLAHELRNPLAPIRNGLQVIRLSQDRIMREQSQEMMDRQLSHMVRLIDDLLDVSRINRNKMELRRSRILLADAVSSAIETARPAIQEAGHKLEVALHEEPVFLDADLTRLAQVFSNLLTNSAKYTEAGGRIRLTAHLDSGDVVVTVEDTGIGIPAEALPHIFDMFSQVDRSIERSTGGLGIGLALVKGLVEMHGGRVSATSGGQGQGSEFTVRLPVIPTRPDIRTLQEQQVLPDSGPKRRILVVDDNRDSAESMALMLRLFGNDVAIAFNGLEAVDRADSFRPDVILMDIGMPHLNGYDATRRIRQQPWGKPMTIIALTGWGQDGDRIQTKEAGCNDHLVKPVSLQDLQKMLRELV